ncbi:MAG: 30S ribosomal protein S12 methylthiotransferase RimO [Wujia sp.]
MNILMVSLGCDKNLCDSETMLGMLRAEQYNITNDENEADVVVVNTCSFIKDAMEESINTILEMAKLKQGRLKYLIVAGCLAERFKDEICDEIPEIDACIGTASYDRIVSVIRELEAENCEDDSFHRVMIYDDIDRLADSFRDKVITSGTFMGYLKIAEGCDKFCTYCIIPHIRGHYRSVPMEQLIAQARYMAEQGITEIVLVAQETTCYGMDLYHKKALPELIHKLAQIDGIQWIRLMYCYPEEITDEMIAMFANEPKLVHYIDMPIQHSEDRILKRMGRKTDRASILDVIARLRKQIPDIAIRTSLIAGFPGETEDEHEALMEFLDEVELDRVGVFTYSREDGTPAAKFSDQVDEETATRWQNEIMELQQEISQDKNDSLVGTTIKVVVEGYSPDDDVYVGRTYRDAPNVDGLVFVKCDYELMSGSYVDVIIREAGPYDLIGEIKDEFTE